MAKSKFFKILGKNILPILAGIILLCILCNISYNNALVEGFKEGIPHALHHKYAAGAHRKKWQAELQGLKTPNKKGGDKMRFLAAKTKPGCNRKKCAACRGNFVKTYNSLSSPRLTVKGRKWGREAKKAGCGPKGFPCSNSCAKCGSWANPCQKKAK